MVTCRQREKHVTALSRGKAVRDRRGRHLARLSPAELVKRDSDLILSRIQKMDYTPLLRRALRARSAIRSGILPPQSRFRGNDVKF
jgi:hypothetical protein